MGSLLGKKLWRKRQVLHARSWSGTTQRPWQWQRTTQSWNPAYRQFLVCVLTLSAKHFCRYAQTNCSTKLNKLKQKGGRSASMLLCEPPLY